MSLICPADMQQILREDITISATISSEVKLPDEVGGDMFFSIKLCVDSNDLSSFTRLSINDDFHAEVQIYNADPRLVVSPTQLIPVGTYGTNYDLFLTFELSQENAAGLRNCAVAFYIKTMNHGGQK